MPQHGFARNALWTLDEAGDGRAVLSLAANDTTRSIWPHEFKLRLRIQFDDSKISTHLDVENPKAGVTGSEPAPFALEALQHSYFYVGKGNDAISHVRVAGLKGVTYLSKPHGNAAFTEESESIAIQGEVDRIYCNTP